MRKGLQRAAVAAVSLAAAVSLVIAPSAPATAVTRQVATFNGGLSGSAPYRSGNCYPGTSMVSHPSASCSVTINSLSPRACDLRVGELAGYATFYPDANENVSVGPFELRGAYIRGSGVVVGVELRPTLEPWVMTINLVDACDGDQGTKVFFGNVTA